MKFGLATFPTAYSTRPAELAREAEARGFDAIFFPEHTHIPASRRTAFPRGGELPKEYVHCMDPFVSLAAAATATKSMKVGTGICLVVERDPITTAKEVATLDVVSEGRVIFGVGGGWNAEEMENHGTDPSTRFRLMRERVEAMKKIWTEEAAEYHGRFVRFDPIWSYPKPIQKPHPPILLGGRGEPALRRVVRYGDGWLPLPRNREELTKGMADLRRLASEAGRDPKSISVTVFYAEASAEAVDFYESQGVERVLFGVPPEGRETTIPLLDRHAKLVH